MSQNLVSLERRGHVALVTICRPEALNALNADVLAELAAAFETISADPTIRGVVLTGHGGKAFVAGADIAQMIHMSPEEAMAFAGKGMSVMNGVEACPVPVLAAVDGFALGGGLELALACDWILATPKSKFATPEVKLGVTPGFGGTQRLARLVGPNRARDLVCTGRMIDAQTALAWGLIEEIVAEGPVLDRALDFVEMIAANGPLAVAQGKRLVLEGGDASIQVGLSMEKKAFSGLFETLDRKEGMEAFLGKRKPQFQGR